ncbi:MAG: choice-of-anchor Q domain-containing protein [Kofleriaceae bacterium]
MKTPLIVGAVALAAVLPLFGCTTVPNPAVCCISAEDCRSIGADEVERPCDPGLACVEHQCEPAACAEGGCTPAAPVCELTTNVCVGCRDSADCMQFADTPMCSELSGACVQCVDDMSCVDGRCDLSSNSCVQCLLDADCPNQRPICTEEGVCRGCIADSECSSGACTDDGQCAPESAVAYLDPGGTDSGSCSRIAPCRTLPYAVQQLDALRVHVVMANGGYVGTTWTILSAVPSRVFVHGSAASLIANSESSVLVVGPSVAVTIRNLRVSNPAGFGIEIGGASSRIEDVTVRALARGIRATSTDLVNVDVEGAGIGIQLGGASRIERARIANCDRGLVADAGADLELRNMLVSGSSTRAFDGPSARGFIEFSTLVTSGVGLGTGARGVLCGTELTVRASIIWTDGSGSRAPISGCNLANIIVGPSAVPGGNNVNPQFVDPTTDDYHLGPSSPARDKSATGPSVDYEGHGRPIGASYDLGADEAQ